MLKGDKMHISENLVEVFRDKYELKHGQNISASEAEQMLSDLAETIKIINGKERSYHEEQ